MLEKLSGNLLYIYPQFLNFSNRHGSARNITVKIQFLEGEGPDSALPVIFGKSGFAEYANECYTPVAYHSKSPFFYEEVKMKLPSNLNEKHHLLFTYYHVNCQPKLSQEAPEVPVGYSWFSMLDNGHLRSGSFELPVCLEKLPHLYSVTSLLKLRFSQPLFLDCWHGHLSLIFSGSDNAGGLLYFCGSEDYEEAKQSFQTSLGGLKWLDNRKAVFKLELRPVSTIYPQDRNLERFFSLCESAGEHHAVVQQTEALRQAVSALKVVPMEELICFLYVVLDKLLTLLTLGSTKTTEGALISKEIFEMLITIVDQLHSNEEMTKDSMGRNQSLATYVHHLFSMPVPNESEVTESEKYATIRPESATAALRMMRKLSTSDSEVQAAKASVAGGSGLRPAKLFHEELAYHIVFTNGTMRNQVYRHLWFFCELLVKSMSQYVSDTVGWNSPRSLRYPEHFPGIIYTLVNIATEFVKHQDPEITDLTNLSLGFFLNDLLSLMDRGFVLRMIGHHHKELSDRDGNRPHLHDQRIDFLRIICSHEHFVILNLPLTPGVQTLDGDNQTEDAGADESTVGIFKLSRKFRQQHFLIGLLLQEVANALTTDSERLIRRETVSLLHCLLASHDGDRRFHDRGAKVKVAALYHPLLDIILNSVPVLADYDYSRRKYAKPYPNPGDTSSLVITSSPVVTASTNRHSAPIPGPPASTMPAELTQTVLFCFLWVLKNADEAALREWIVELPAQQQLVLLYLLDLCVSTFEYEGQPSTEQISSVVYRKSRDMKLRLEKTIFGTTGARREMMKRREYPGIEKLFTGGNAGLHEKLRWRKDLTQWRQPVGRDKMKLELEQEALINGNLTVETNLIVLDTLELLIQLSSPMPELRPVVTGVLKVLIHSLACNQSTLYLKDGFNTQRAFITKFPEVLFEGDPEHCTDLCFLLLQRSTSHFESTRTQASASLYLLMRQSYHAHFPKAKMYITITLASLSEKLSNQDKQCLQQTLTVILSYLEADRPMERTSFPVQVEEFLRNLNGVLCDTVKLQEFPQDVDMQIDLMYRVAKGLQSYVDLRLLWLRKLLVKHVQRGNHAEAAHCLVHSAALLAEYLNRVDGSVHLPMGSVSFQKISLNVLEESLVSEDIFSMEREGVWAGNSFSEEGLLKLLDEAAKFFNKAEFYEAVYEIHKLIIPIAEFHRNIEKLSVIHGSLKATFDLILSEDNKRMFGTYFRVGFYGSLFGELDDQEYVYKEPAITKLVEISSRLEEFYKAMFGQDRVEIIKDSAPVKKENLEPDKAYVQVTYVEPYFEDYELKNRVSNYERSSNLRRFIYSTPYTLDGRAHGELSQQYKRKTILTTSHAFPYIKTRINVIEKQEMSLRPIEAVIEDMQKKTQELAKATSENPPNLKLLQMVLQGSVGPTVNQGPLEVAQVFLSEIPDDPKLYRHHNKLRICFKNFLKRCEDALIKNKGLISSERVEYQNELERNYEALKYHLQPFLNQRIPHLYITPSQ